MLKNVEADDGRINRVQKLKIQDRKGFVEIAAKYHGLIIDRHEVMHRQVDERAPLPELLERSKAAPGEH